MSVSLTVYPVAEKAYDGSADASDHALKFRVQCEEGLFKKVTDLPGREIGRLVLNFVPDTRTRYQRGDRGLPLRAVNAHKLASVLDKYTTTDRQSMSHAVVAFLRCLPPGAEAVPFFAG